MSGTAVPQPPVQAPPDLFTTAEAAFDLAVAQGMPRAGHSHTGRALCAVVAEWNLHLQRSPESSKTTSPTKHLPSPAAAPGAGSAHAAYCRVCICICSGPWHVQG